VRAATPIHILRAQAGTIINLLPQLRDGQVEAVHDVRVASRRIREVLPLVTSWYSPHDIDELEETFREIGRNLGRVRDADARLALLTYLGTRVPPASALLAALGRQQEEDRLRLMRKLIKRFERLDVERDVRALAARPAHARRLWAGGGRRWPQQLRHAVGERAGAARESVHRATGVYFPNRSHGARIALKKLRYALEIVCAAGNDPAVVDSLQYLKKTQDVLGDLHDRQVLVDDLRASAASLEGVEVDPSHITLVRQFVAAESRDLHTRFAGRRSRLLEISDRFERIERRGRVPVAPAAVGVVICSAYFLWRRGRAPRPQLREHDIAMTIPIPARAMIAR
jgi:CHAD domain-containing protein